MAAPPRRALPRLVAVAGGKGGVGKSTIAANLAIAVGRLGRRVALVDADLGAANLHTMLGVLHPAGGLADFLDHRVEALEQTAVSIAPNVALVPGTSRPGAANLASAQKLRLLRAIARLDAECVVLDVGAGTSFTVVDLVAASDLKLFVLTPQLPSLHNAYALLKACVHRVVRRLSADEVQHSLIDAALANEHKARTIPQLLAVIRPLDGALADRIVDTLLRFGAGRVGNQLGGDGDAQALGRMSPLIHDHLLVHAPVIAAIRRSAALAGGLRAGANTIAERDDTAAAFRGLARAMMDCDLTRLRGEARVAAQQTMPLWITREIDETAAGT
ncbi:MAG: nucleotide-binding protein [Kofleriaceae bacterium]